MYAQCKLYILLIAVVANQVMKRVVYPPNFLIADQTAAMNIKQGVQQNTSPTSPPVPKEVSTGLQSIETMRANDNL